MIDAKASKPQAATPKLITLKQYMNLYSVTRGQVLYLARKGRLTPHEILGVTMYLSACPPDTRKLRGVIDEELKQALNGVPRDEAIRALAKLGKTYAAIASHFGLSRCRVQQIASGTSRPQKPHKARKKKERITPCILT